MDHCLGTHVTPGAVQTAWGFLASIAVASVSCRAALVACRAHPSRPRLSRVSVEPCTHLSGKKKHLRSYSQVLSSAVSLHPGMDFQEEKPR